MKKYLIVYYGDAPECVEGFGKDCKRSCKGALHVNPGRQMTVTEGELAYLKSKYKHMLPKLRILSEMEEEVKPAAKEVKAESKEKAKAEPKDEAKEEKDVEEAEPKKAHKGKKYKR